MTEFRAFTPEEEVTRGRQALSVLENEIYKEACKLIEEGLAVQRARVPLTETAMHTRLILAEQIWLQLKDHIQQTADTGKWMLVEEQRKEREKESLLRRMLNGGLRAA